MFHVENIIIALISFPISKIMFVASFKVEVAPNKRYPGLSEVRIVVSNETAAFGERAEGRHDISGIDHNGFLGKIVLHLLLG